MKKMWLKLISLLMALVLLSLGVVACVDTGDTDDTTTGAGVADDSADDSNSLYDKNGYLLDDIPDEIDFGGDIVTTLYWEDVENPEFFVEETSGDTVEEAIFSRNATVEDRLGLTMEFVPTKGNYDNQNTFLTAVRNESNGGGGDYDIYAAYSMTIANVVAAGFCQDLNDYPDIIKFDKPWWPENLLEEATVGDSLYMASGDLSTNMLYMMYVCYFNKDLILNFQLEDPYTLVKNDNWTYEKFFGMMATIGPVETESDSSIYGFTTTTNVHFDSFFYAAGLRTTDRDENGIPQVSESFGSERTDSVINMINTYFHGGYAKFYDTDKNIFNGNRALFMVERAHYATRYLGNISDFEYGILPLPKYDLNQEAYSTCLGFPYTLYAIADKATDGEAAAYLLECLCSEGYRTITPALFEIVMKARYTTDSDAAAMFDIIRQNVSFDFGRIYNVSLNEITWRVFRAAISDNSGGISSNFKPNKAIMERRLSELLATFEAME